MNQHKWKVERRARDTLMHIIQSRLDSKDSVNENDLLGLMLESYSSNSNRKQEEHSMSMEEIIDERKTFFFAGYEATSHLLTWTMFLLSTNQEWQERLRKEVLRECGMAILDTDNLSKLKLVYPSDTMHILLYDSCLDDSVKCLFSGYLVILETLRLYAPVVVIQRLAAKDMNLGNLMIPKDTILTIPIAMIHRSKEIWGADANHFNPLRFENGISKAAKHPNALLSFSIGPRSCIGQNLALLEAKMVIAMILQWFSFSLSSHYIHAPLDMFTLQPQYGLPVVLKPLHV